MNRRSGALALVGLLVVAGAATGCSRAAEPAAPGGSATTSGPAGPVDPVVAAKAFLTSFVDADGRVVRRDQGADSVSAGQAYGLALAVQAGDVATAQRIWAWTQDNLQRPDGLLSRRWQGGEVVEADPAGGADLLTAQALVLAGEEFGRPALRDQGIRIAGAVLDRETVPTPVGRVLLDGPSTTAGPWRVSLGDAAPAALTTLEVAVPDARWAELRTGTAAVLDRLRSQAPLPPDWAEVTGDGRVEAGVAPDGTAAGFGLDAARVVVQDAASCVPGDRARSAALAPVLVRDTAQVRGAYDLAGTATVDRSHPVALVAAAAAAGAADDPDAERRLLDAAADLERQTPTYLGSAWVAWGAALLTPTTGNPFGVCP